MTDTLKEVEDINELSKDTIDSLARKRSIEANNETNREKRAKILKKVDKAKFRHADAPDKVTKTSPPKATNVTGTGKSQQWGFGTNKGYGQGHYMGDSVEQADVEDQLDEANLQHNKGDKVKVHLGGIWHDAEVTDGPHKLSGHIEAKFKYGKKNFKTRFDPKTEVKSVKEEVESLKEMDTTRTPPGKAPEPKAGEWDWLKKQREERAAKKKTNESVEELDEAHKLKDEVVMSYPSLKGVKGHIGEIRHGAYKGAPKTYTIDYQHPKHPEGNMSSIQLSSDQFKAHKPGKLGEEVEEQLEEGILSKISGKIMGTAPEKPKYKVGQVVSYQTNAHQPEWKDGGSGKGEITKYSNGHYTINGNPVNHFEIKKVHEEVESLDELSKNDNTSPEWDEKRVRQFTNKKGPNIKKSGNTSLEWDEKRVKQFTGKKVEEEVESLDELSMDTVKSYKEKVSKNPAPSRTTSDILHKAIRRFAGKERAEDRIHHDEMVKMRARLGIKEEVEQVEEGRFLKPKTEKPPKSTATMSLNQLLKNKKENPGQSPFKTQDDKVKKYLGEVEETLDEGLVDSVKRGIKSVKRGMQGWGTPEYEHPRAVVNRAKNLSDKDVKGVHVAINAPGQGIYGKGEFKDPDKHSPAGLQKRVLDREMKKRGLTSEEVLDESDTPDRMKGKQKPYVSSDGKGNYEVLGNTGQTKATFSRATHGKDAHVAAQRHLRSKYNEYMKEETLDEASHAEAFKSETDSMKPGTKKYVGRKDNKEVHAKKDEQGNVKFYHKDGIKGQLKSVQEETLDEAATPSHKVGDTVYATSPTNKALTMTGKVTKIGATLTTVKHKDGSEGNYPHKLIGKEYSDLHTDPAKKYKQFQREHLEQTGELLTLTEVKYMVENANGGAGVIAQHGGIDGQAPENTGKAKKMMGNKASVDAIVKIIAKGSETN